MVPSAPSVSCKVQQKAVWSLAGATWSKPSHLGMTNPTLAAIKRPFAAVVNWAEKNKLSHKEGWATNGKIPVQRLILVWEGRCFCQKKGCIEKRSCFLFDQRGTWAARRKMEVYGWRKTQVYGNAAGREGRFHQNRDFCSCSCRCAGVCVEGERCCTSGTGQDVNNTKMWLFLPSRKVLFFLFFPPFLLFSFLFFPLFFFAFLQAPLLLSSQRSPIHVFILQPAVDQGKRYSLGWIPKNGYSWALLTWSPPCGFPIFLGIRTKTKEAEFRNSNGFSNMWDISQTLTSCRHKSCSAFHVHTSPILNPEQTAKLFPRRTRSVTCISWVISRAQPCRTATKHMLGLKQGARARALGLRAVLMSKWFPQLWLEAWDEDGLCAEIYGLVYSEVSRECHLPSSLLCAIRMSGLAGRAV